MTHEADEDRLVAEWHELAEVAESGSQIDFSKVVSLVDLVIHNFAPSLTRPTDEREVLAFISTTRKLEKTWNYRLGRALIEAEDALSRGDRELALSILDQIIAQCPRIPFVSVAKDQRANYASER